MVDKTFCWKTIKSNKEWKSQDGDLLFLYPIGKKHEVILEDKVLSKQPSKIKALRFAREYMKKHC